MQCLLRGFGTSCLKLLYMQNRKKEVDYTLKKYVTVFIFLYILKDTYQVFLNNVLKDSKLTFSLSG